MKIEQFILNLSRPQKRIVSIIFDTLFVVAAYWGALITRYADITLITNVSLWQGLAIVWAVTIWAFVRLGLYRAILRYMTFQALVIVAFGAAISMISFSLIGFYGVVEVSKTVPIIYGAFLAILAGCSRMLMRGIFARQTNAGNKRVLIYGAGAAGRQLCIALRQSNDYAVAAFVDADHRLQGSNILGLRVFHTSQIEQVIDSLEIDKVLLALPRASRIERKQIIDDLANISVEVKTVPKMEDIVSGAAKIDELHDVPIEDLLGRDPVEPKAALMAANTQGKVVMVTGAGGSIGSELCRQIIRQRPKKLLLFELSEYCLYQIEKELVGISEQYHLGVEIIPLLGSVQRENRLKAIMESFKVNTVYHAAAYKHVPLVEYNVVEGVRNNVFGTLACAQAAIRADVETFVLISTDKAVRPTNVMGASKRMAELVLQAFTKQGHGTRFCMVRFGNVLGSSGSVIPLFKEQIRQGGPITVTHPDIIRYFMTIPEAAQLVIQAGAMGHGGDVFVLDMGEPVKIADLAKNLIHLSGLEVRDENNPNGDIALEYSGLRPGEKLYEELLIGDKVKNTSHERIMTAQEVSLDWMSLKAMLDKLDAACHQFDHDLIRGILLDAPTGFQPTDGINDLVWLARKENSNVIPLSEVKGKTQLS